MARFTAAITREDDWYLARCLEVDVVAQGTSLERALVNLVEAVALALDDPQAPVPTMTPWVTWFEIPAPRR